MRKLKRLCGFLAFLIARFARSNRNRSCPPQPPPWLSFSALSQAARCGYALHLRRSGVIEKPSEAVRRGRDFHRAVAAILRREEYEPQCPETLARIELIRNELEQIAILQDLEVEKELVWEAGGGIWKGFVDALGGGQVFEFKTTERLPAEIPFADYLQASIYAHVTSSEKIVFLYVTDKKYKKIETTPLPDTPALLSRLGGLFKDFPAIPHGLFHPYACAYCAYAHACEFARYRLGEGLTKPDLPF